jgi:hypothetical protein
MAHGTPKPATTFPIPPAPGEGVGSSPHIIYGWIAFLGGYKERNSDRFFFCETLTSRGLGRPGAQPILGLVFVLLSIRRLWYFFAVSLISHMRCQLCQAPSLTFF